MHLTNKYNLPEAIVRATKKRNENYNSNADRSVTQLISPPRIDQLRKKHYKDIEKDISEEFFALLGSATHQILEWGADGDDVVEERLYARVRGWVISGAMDVQRIGGDTFKIIDYKVCSTYTFTKDEGKAKPEWEQQQNIYALLARINKGINVTKISICAIYRDWKSAEAQRNPQYPQSPILEIDVPVWPEKQQLKYLLDRVRLHQEAEMLHDMGSELPLCTEEDMWVNGTLWSVRKTGGTRSSKNFYTEDEANKFAEEKGEGYEVIKKPGKPNRCAGNYCGVAQWCSQFAAMQALSLEEKQSKTTGKKKVKNDGAKENEEDGQEEPPEDRLAGSIRDQEEIQGGEDEDEPWT